MTDGEKFAAWLNIYQMEDWAPEAAPYFTAMQEFLEHIDYMLPSKAFLDDMRKACEKEEAEHRAGDNQGT